MSNQDWIKIWDGEHVSLDVISVYDVFSRFSLPPGLVIDDLDHALNGKMEGLPAPIAGVYRRILQVAVEELTIDLGAARIECWSNRIFEAGSVVEYHVDNDEIFRRRTGNVVMPNWGLILYVGPDEQDVGGTYFNLPIEKPEDDNNLFCNPIFDEVVKKGGRSVPFHVGRLILFDGRSPHCVVPFERLTRPRVTIMANIWKSEGTQYRSGQS